MNKRFCKLGQYAAKAFFLFAVCGATYSCKDDYMWDDGNPSWLGSSIYEYLESQGNYTNFVKLIDDLDYKEVLARTGSKTLFVADDDAFAAFYQSNSWGVRSYDQLSLSQKRLLLNNAMVDNANLLEMMSSTPAGSGDNDLPEKGQALRRVTSANVTDSVPHLFADDLPISYNEKDKDYWARFRNNDKGIYMALDATTPMMTHFLAAQMANKNITDEDFAIITGQQRTANDAFIYGCRIIKPANLKIDPNTYTDTLTTTCQNGYVYRLDKVLVNPQNMAEVLRTNGRTNIFSHMLDRFSAPFYSQSLTDSYRLLYGNAVDSVWQKRYFSERSQGNSSLINDAGTDPVGSPTGTDIFNTSNNRPLPYDPGWNTYRTDSKVTQEQDMAAIFCPTDEKMMEYFFSAEGGGRFLISAYAPDLLNQIDENTTDLNLVYQAIDQIPRETIRALLNNLMKDSFNNTVPSKFESIKNSAQDAMFDEKFDYHREKIVDVLLANNGVIYLMDEVTTPAEYAAVSAPAYVETDKRIFNWAIQSESLGGIPTTYYAYLLAMSSRFSFFVPNDNDFWYIDPVSFHTPENELGTTVLTGRAYKYTWDATKATNQLSVASYQYKYDAVTKEGVIGDLVSNENVGSSCYGNRLKDMLETHTIIHEDNSEITGIDETETGAECDKHYYYAKNNAVVYIDNASLRNHGMIVKGGWQIANEDYRVVTGFDDKSAQTNGYGNGFAYMINQPLIPTIESVYSILYNNPNFSKFLELCETDGEVIDALKNYDDTGKEKALTATEKNKYYVFSKESESGLPCYGFRKDENGEFTSEFARITDATNVRFFNNYRYTIYIPTNDAIEKAQAAGLPTWQDLREILELDVDPDERQELTAEETIVRNNKVMAMATAIINFVKYHFQDNCIFADTPSMAETAYETATLNSETGVYRKVSVLSAGNGTLSVKDATGKTHNITEDKNLVARDYHIKGSGTTVSSAINKTITSSSSAVIHGIDGVLDYKTYENNRYDSDWATLAKARAYLKKYRLVE